VLEGYRVIVGWYDTAAVVLYLDGVKTIVLEANLCIICQLSCLHQSSLCEADVPIEVAPASMLFSTSSLQTDCRSTITWPDWIWWTERPSMGLIVAMSTHCVRVGTVAMTSREVAPACNALWGGQSAVCARHFLSGNPPHMCLHTRPVTRTRLSSKKSNLFSQF